MKRLVFRAALIGGLLAAGQAITAKAPADVVINARVYNGYARTKLADGSFKPERYGVAEGGRWNGTKIDPSLDGLPFRQIVQTIAGPLRAQGFLPSSDPKRTDLLILVFWGVTTGADEGQYDHGLAAFGSAIDARPAEVGPDDGSFNAAVMFQAMENHMREQNNRTNAGILGYTDAFQRARELRQIGFAAGDTAIWELEANRYFVVLKAYDFPFAVKEKKLRLLWEARFSIYEHGNRFDGQLLPMTQAASKYFGQDTAGLVRHDVRQGKVEVGTPTVVEDQSAPPHPR